VGQQALVPTIFIAKAGALTQIEKKNEKNLNTKPY
jgi:hypothetical protein